MQVHAYSSSVTCLGGVPTSGSSFCFPVLTICAGMRRESHQVITFTPNLGHHPFLPSLPPLSLSLSLLVSHPDPPISAALGVLHHQHAERKVWKLLHGFRVF